jgi:hypothetical protein
MAGNTARIDSATLSIQWLSNRPMAEIAQHWTITSHQLVRLREVWGLPPRNDRRLRHKPSRADRLLDPTPEELAASEGRLDLAPAVAARVTVVQATWSLEDRHDRQAVKPQPFTLARIELTDDVAAFFEELSDESEW